MKQKIFQVESIRDCNKVKSKDYYYVLNMINFNGDILPEMFEWQEYLTFVICGSRHKVIGDRAFANCINLTRVDARAEIIGKQAFAFCGDLKDFNFEKVNSLSENSFEFSGLESIYLPDTLERIPYQCFQGTLRLKKLFLNNIKIIEEGAFTSSGLRVLDIPSSVSVIGKGAFEACIHLSDIIIESNTPPKIYSNTFSGCQIKNIFFFSESQKLKFEKDKNWSKYKEYFRVADSKTIRARLEEIKNIVEWP